MHSHAQRTEDDALLTEVLASLRETPPRLPPKLFYDEVGSELFEQISRLPEYGLTRAEESIFAAHAKTIVEAAGGGAASVAVLEPGCGGSAKAASLLAHLHDPLYVGIDISPTALSRGAQRIRAQVPGAQVRSVVADTATPFEVSGLGDRHRIAFFPGSTIGNERPPQAVAFLRRLAALAGPSGSVIVGTDLWRAPALLRLAYDDPAGVTARFNKNALRHLQWRLGAQVDPEGFVHVIAIDEPAMRVEMHLEARGTQELSLGGERFKFQNGQRIHTEDSHKFTVQSFLALAAQAGLKPVAHWLDASATFAVHVLKL